MKNLAFGNRLRSTHCREFHYLKLYRPAYFVRTTQGYLTLANYVFSGDSDLAGPLCFCLAFGSFLMLSGKLHFNYIYGNKKIATRAEDPFYLAMDPYLI